MAEPSVAVVVAAWPDVVGVGDCLAALEEQRDPATDEVWVVAARSCAATLDRHSWARFIAAPPGLLVPQLWSLGIQAAGSDVVALTTAQFVPAPDWLAVLRAGHARLLSPAIGGPIDPPRGGRPRDWASYFLRYSAYLGVDREQAASDLPGDNASYKRAALLAAPEFLADGFWEHEFHGHLRRAGLSLVLLPEMRVALRRSPSLAAFAGQRWRHGHRFGSTRVRSHGSLWRGAALAGSPLIPVVLLAKVVRHVLLRRRDVGALFRALPLLGVFAVAWGLGEACAYAVPGRRVLRSATPSEG